ncbi:uncharacterized protein Gasu_32600 [Galdieria sulphuraria]|uniref:Glycosyl hydrolase family 32 N-terminal domain-containing protein n=1 Tax=Galdieria sulphuraria TaxID=130081 RepID=M2Y034_GALSU|nr:uncharacterized protein Gasu_32600 [Galdieria sulphuraria]EME29248.1 hypothetical protein Gasu_32600 [Galdieria sulphuraria]|eukprot:XP_005705768.1 hypothetical protein Gasu_32600 [Galdieria sulphuraria]
MDCCLDDCSRDKSTLYKLSFLLFNCRIGGRFSCLFCSHFIETTRKYRRYSLPRSSTAAVRKVALICQSRETTWNSPFQGPGLIFCHSEDKYAFDSKQIGGPVVLKEREEHEETIWKMWYYGRSIGFPSKSNLVDLPTGCIGYATSKDGIHWNRMSGLEEQGSVLAPSRSNEDDFDSAHVGVSDVVLRKIESDLANYNVYHVYYFGGNNAISTVQIASSNDKRKRLDIVGLKMLPGLAISTDGFQFTRIRGDCKDGALLSVAPHKDFDSLYCGWPRVVTLDESHYMMYYHGLDPTRGMFVVGMAVSPDGFSRWRKLGPLRGLGWENDNFSRPGAFDERGWGTRHVIRNPSDPSKWLMFFEAVSRKGIHSIGIATSQDGLTWSRLVDYPILIPGDDQVQDSWDSGAIGCPHAVVQQDNSIWLYYVGFERKEHGGPFRRTGFGLACSEGTDYTRFRKYKDIQ